MRRDLLLQAVVALDAKLNRIERLSRKIGSAEEHKARIPPLLGDARDDLRRLCGRLSQLEGKGYVDITQRIEQLGEPPGRMQPPP